jgi:hypothetical protein
MGANATTFVPSYTSGEVLTAADLTVTNSGIPVFADSTARTAGFGGTGEKVLAEGQYAYLESDNSTSFYDGASWQTIGGGMTLLSTTTLSGATTAITGISQDYVNLFITIEKWYASSAANLRMYVNADSTAGNYFATYIRGRVGTNTATYEDTFQVSAWQEGPGQHNNLIVVNIPYYASSSYKTYSQYGMMDTDNGQKGTYIGATAYFGAVTAISSLTFAPSAGTFSAGTVKIYGVK